MDDNTGNVVADGSGFSLDARTSRKIELLVYADGATTEWDIAVADYYATGAFDLRLDKSHVRAGDKLTLTVDASSSNTTTIFTLTSTDPTTGWNNVWYGLLESR